MGKFELPPANPQNIGQWMDVVDSWAIPMIVKFGKMRVAVLGELLRTEKYVARLFDQSEPRQPPPPCAEAPGQYDVRPRGSERPRQRKLDWWSRFTLADGFFPSILRFAVASTIVSAVVVSGFFVGNAKVYVYNGLDTPVQVTLDDQRVDVSPLQYRAVTVGLGLRCQVEARTPDGRQIESFSARINRAFANYVYNVAGAAPMVEWYAAYGNASQRAPDLLGCPRWRVTGAQYIFAQPTPANQNVRVGRNTQGAGK